ncbi:MAG TPA: HdeD family acid-resistance protein [Acidimicrobiales bacterium]|nr:HdeD family acid-resistance protein [Acidimicrobiales bacterium]
MTDEQDLTTSWQLMLFAGLATLVIGLIVAFHPSTSLNVISVLIGILFVIGGIIHLIRVLDHNEPHRVWLGIAGLLLIVIGIICIRHLHLTQAALALIIGIAWIVQGVIALIAGIGGGSRQGRGWWIFFGLVSLAAGIVVAANPSTSITVLAILVGIWFAVMGALEIVGAFILRHAVKQAASSSSS